MWGSEAAAGGAECPAFDDTDAFATGLDAFGIGNRIVPALRVADLFAPLAMAVVSAILASAWPALRAAGLRPSEALRHA